MSSPLVWIDLEMTGLDHNSDSILEVACIITDKDLNHISPPFECIIHHSKDRLDQMTDWCLKTHGDSGLIQRCIESTLTLDQAQDSLLEFIKASISSKSEGILAGSIT
jgi:oligoribonuclease